MGFKEKIMKIKKIYILLMFLVLTGCGGSILDESSLDTNSIQIQGIAVTSASSTASIIWTTDVPATHKIMYGTASGNYTQSSSESTAETTTHQVDLSGLITDQVYYYKIVCNSNGFETVESAEYSFTTSSSITVTLLTSGSITTSSAVITWTTNVATTHIVEYGTTAGVYTHSTVQSSSPSTTHSVMLSGLTSGTEYFYRVKNFHATLPFTSSTDLSFITTGVITVSGITESSDTSTITIGWNTNLPTTHSIDYGTASGTLSSSTTPSVVASTIHSVTLTGLVKGRIYYYRINNTHATLGTVSTSERSYSTTPTIAQKLRSIWIVGGMSAQSMAVPSNTIGEIDMFDPVTNTWYSAITTLPTPVSFSATVGYNGKIYVLGGFNNTGTPVGFTQIYDVASDSWGAGAAMSNVRANNSAVVISGKIYVTRGTTGTYNTAWSVAGVPLNTLIYTIASNSWSATGITDSAVSNKSVVALGDIVYYMGGKSATSTIVNTFDGISTSSNALTSGITELVLSAARVGFSSVVYTDSFGAYNILAMGGFSLITNATGNYVFNTVTAATPVDFFQYIRYPFVTPSAWVSASNNLPAAIGFGAAVKRGSTLYYFGGTSYPINAQSLMYSYDLTNFPSGSWTNLTGSTPMPRVRFGHDAVIINE
jgi:N-acetylneuraminic acid mutarotase